MDCTKGENCGQGKKQKQYCSTLKIVYKNQKPSKPRDSFFISATISFSRRTSLHGGIQNIKHAIHRNKSKLPHEIWVTGNLTPPPFPFKT